MNGALAKDFGDLLDLLDQAAAALDTDFALGSTLSSNNPAVLDNYCCFAIHKIRAGRSIVKTNYSGLPISSSNRT